MKIHDVTQGSPEWLALRVQHDCASDAAAMLGLDARTSRQEYLRMRATGSEKVFSEWVRKNLLERGHAVEAATRAIAEEIIGDDLYAVVGTETIEGMPLLASFDGLNMAETCGWEGKLKNADLIAAITAGDLPDTHWPQVEQQMLISGASTWLFTSGDGTPAGTYSLRYQSRPERRARVISGWRQFHADLDAYVHQEVIPAPVAAALPGLPVLAVQVRGEIVTSNLAAYRETALAVIASISTDPKTDQEFADAEKMVKFCAAAEKEIDSRKAAVLTQVIEVEQVTRTMDELREAIRAKRLMLTNLITARKESIRSEIIMAARQSLAERATELNADLGGHYIEVPQVDFAAAIKGLKTLTSARNAVESVLLEAQSAMDSTAARIRANLDLLASLPDYAGLFPDVAKIASWEPAQFQILVTSRIDGHKVAEAARIEVERARIRAEEEAKAREQAAAEASAKAAAEEAERRGAEAKAAADRRQAEVATTPAYVGTALTDGEAEALRKSLMGNFKGTAPETVTMGNGFLPMQASGPVQTVPPVSENRAAVLKALAALDEDGVYRVLRFIESRYPQAVAA